MNAALRTHQQRLARIRLSTINTVLQMWDALPDYHSEQAQPFAARAVPIIRSGQMLTARSTSAYVSQRTGIRPVKLDPAKVTGEAVRKGVVPQEAYQRPFGIVWGALADGVSLDQAIQRGSDRLALMAASDVWGAMRAASAYVAEQSDAPITWIRRADAGACDLCVAADGTPYDNADDTAGHPFCGCTIEPGPGDASSTASDPEAFSVSESDELGPLLADA